MNRIEQFLVSGTKPFISSYYSPMLSSLVSTKGAEYPFVPFLETRSSTPSYIQSESFESDSCGFDSIAKTLELTLHGVNEQEKNAYSIFWETIWDGLVSYWMGLLTLVPDLFGTIKDLVEWIFALFEPNSEELAELQAALAGIGAFFSSFSLRNLSNLTETLRNIQQDIDKKLLELKKLILSKDGIYAEIKRIEQEIIKLRNLLTFLDGDQWDSSEIIKIEKQLDNLEFLRGKKEIEWAKVEDKCKTLSKLLNDLNKLKQSTIRELEAIQPLTKNLDKLKNLLLRIIKSKPIQKLLKTIAAFAAAIGGIIVAGLEILVAAIFVIGVVFVIGLIDSFFTSISNACKDLLNSIKAFNDQRRLAIDKYFDNIQLRIEAGCCDNPVCRTPSGEFNGCPQLGCGSGSGSSGMGVGAFIAGKMFFNSEEFKSFCGYKKGCVSLPNCTSYTYPVPSGDSQPYTDNTWKYGYTVYDTRNFNLVSGAKERSVFAPDPRTACGWRESYEFTCPDWDAVKTTVKSWLNTAWELFNSSGSSQILIDDNSFSSSSSVSPTNIVPVPPI